MPTKDSDLARRALDGLEAAQVFLSQAKCLGDGCPFGTEDRYRRKPDSYCTPCLARHLNNRVLSIVTSWHRTALVREVTERCEQMQRSSRP